MKNEIERISLNDIEQKRFLTAYLDQEKPFILTDVIPDADQLTPEYIKNRFGKESLKDLGWYNSALVEDDDISIPDIIKYAMQRSDMSFRELPMRIFMQPRGHVTLPHYDGSSLHGFNLQITGAKRWILTSPHTPLPTIPFMFAAMVSQKFIYDPRHHDFMEFETRAGDLLFLPRYWFHEVHALDEINLNLNWVCTPIEPNEKNPLGKREVELMKLKKTVPFVHKALGKDLSNYGSSGPVIFERYTRDVSNFRVWSRLFKEIIKYPRLLFLFKELKTRANEFSKNNFNIEER
ncbi:MAG: cupin-like domain-containing protein [Burkholderiales bacterium]|uniref:cupin-like domain-containing protein n=1 Tax=Nitrosomonas sp. TaxID=42353 RepID=UPI001D9D7BAA|nr:cupin-like domain-containing protein [Nitrosomonas sp.]MCB1948251.1 cupin-like domain-containing protein [Nitrosomonas sp.]MCP5246675.1 cupin-like domain-containing protein [Burkholderiales bacterium]MDR4514848.1 cupin-like domain-containing protein [Nitrosomonas sp.]